jgi:quinol-cytochrome oxidoreductase complex cytochrome b subunit
MMQADVEAQQEDPEVKHEKAVRKRRSQLLITYYVLQFAVGVFCVLLVLWSIVQGMRVWNVLGVSQEPPGLKYSNDLGGRRSLLKITL